MKDIFNTRTQQLTQSFDTFLTELQLQAKKSAYGTLTNELIHDRLVAGIRDDKVHRRLLSEPDLTPQRCTAVTHATEISQAQMHAIKADETNNVHELRPSRGYKPANQARKLNETGHDKRDHAKRTTP